MSGHPVLPLLLGDVVRLRRRHPCGGDTWQVDRLGADIGLRCTTCDRHVLIERPALERRISEFVQRGNQALSDAVAPQRP
jgi:hypothetical protein